jgi:hypothetical protein
MRRHLRVEQRQLALRLKAPVPGDVPRILWLMGSPVEIL